MTGPVPDTSDALAAPAELVRALRGAPIDPVHAAELVLDASAVVRGYCGWHISEVENDELILDGPGARTLFVPTLAMSALTTVEEDGVALVLADLEWSRGGMIRKRTGASWTRRFSGIRVVCSHGVAADKRRDVARLVITLAAKAYANPAAQTAAAAGVVNDAFGRDHGPVSLSDREQAVLTGWRIR